MWDCPIISLSCHQSLLFTLLVLLLSSDWMVGKGQRVFIRHYCMKSAATLCCVMTCHFQRNTGCTRFTFYFYFSFSISSFLPASHFLFFGICSSLSLSLSIKLWQSLFSFPSFFITPLTSLHPSILPTVWQGVCVVFIPVTSGLFPGHVPGPVSSAWWLPWVLPPHEPPCSLTILQPILHRHKHLQASTQTLYVWCMQYACVQ